MTLVKIFNLLLKFKLRYLSTVGYPSWKSSHFFLLLLLMMLEDSLQPALLTFYFSNVRKGLSFSTIPTSFYQNSVFQRMPFFHTTPYSDQTWGSKLLRMETMRKGNTSREFFVHGTKLSFLILIVNTSEQKKIFTSPFDAKFGPYGIEAPWIFIPPMNFTFHC